MITRTWMTENSLGIRQSNMPKDGKYPETSIIELIMSIYECANYVTVYIVYIYIYIYAHIHETTGSESWLIIICHRGIMTIQSSGKHIHWQVYHDISTIKFIMLCTSIYICMHASIKRKHTGNCYMQEILTILHQSGKLNHWYKSLWLI